MKKRKTGIPDCSKMKFEESEEDQSSSSRKMWEEDEIEQELADVTFEELQKARSNGVFSVFQKTKEEKKSKKANKNRPMEASCKKPVPIFREVVQAPKKALQKKLKTSKDPNVINEAKECISWIDKQLKSDSSKHIDAEILAKHKKNEERISKAGETSLLP